MNVISNFNRSCPKDNSAKKLSKFLSASEIVTFLHQL